MVICMYVKGKQDERTRAGSKWTWGRIRGGKDKTG